MSDKDETVEETVEETPQDEAIEEPQAPDETPDNGAGQPEAPPGTPPESTGTVVGELSEGEHNTLKALQNTAGQLMVELGRLTRVELQLAVQGPQGDHQLGQLQIQKARVVGQYNDVSNKAQHVLNEAAKRMAIPDGSPWQVTPEGKAIVLDQPGGPPPK